MRPRRNDRQLAPRRAFRQHAIFHETVQHDRPRLRVSGCNAASTETAERVIESCPANRRRSLRPDSGPSPRNRTPAFQSHKQCSEKRDQRRRRERHDDVKAPQHQQTQCANDHETGEVERAPPAAVLAERQRRDANYADVLPRVRGAENDAVDRRNRDRSRSRRYVMSARREFRGEIGEVLGCSDHIGVKTLIKKQEPQELKEMFDH